MTAPRRKQQKYHINHISQVEQNENHSWLQNQHTNINSPREFRKPAPEWKNRTGQKPKHGTRANQEIEIENKITETQWRNTYYTAHRKRNHI